MKRRIGRERGKKEEDVSNSDENDVKRGNESDVANDLFVWLERVKVGGEGEERVVYLTIQVYEIAYKMG